MAERIGKEALEEKVKNSHLPVVVEFYSDSCLACKKVSPAFSQTEEVLGSQFHFYKVNANFEAELTEEYKILSNPTLIVLQSGREIGRKAGTQDTQTLISWLKTFLGKR